MSWSMSRLTNLFYVYEENLKGKEARDKHPADRSVNMEDDCKSILFIVHATQGRIERHEVKLQLIDWSMFTNRLNVELDITHMLIPTAV